MTARTKVRSALSQELTSSSGAGASARWPALNDELPVTDMRFVSEPPALIGRVLGAWTNNGPDGPTRPPLRLRLISVWIGAAAGLVVALIGFFVVAGVLESDGVRVSGDSFLWAMGAGTVLGAALGCLPLSRATPALALFVGTDGCAQIEQRDARVREVLLDFREVSRMRVEESVLRASGVRSAAREIHVTKSDGKERLWFVSASPARPHDPQAAFADAVLSAFESHREARTGARPAR